MEHVTAFKGLAHNMELTVLAKTNAPACLIKYGFPTNRGDVAHRDKSASATAKGISDGSRPNDPCTRAETWAMLHRAISGKDGAL